MGREDFPSQDKQYKHNVTFYDRQTGRETYNNTTSYSHEYKMNELEKCIWIVATGGPLDNTFLKQGYVPIIFKGRSNSITNKAEYRNGNFILKSEFNNNQNPETAKQLESSIVLRREIMDDFLRFFNHFKNKYSIELDDQIFYNYYKRQSTINIEKFKECEGIDFEWIIKIIQCAKEQGVKVDEEQQIGRAHV